MKIGIITDIHNNIYALNAVLDGFSKIGIEKIICCGDIIGIGSKPDETVKKLIEIQDILECVRGNHDNYLISGMPSRVPNSEMMSYAEIEQHKWEHSKLSDESKNFIKSLPFTKLLSVGDKKIYIAHYSMNSENSYNYGSYKPVPTVDDLTVMFSNIDADVIVYGHNHRPSVINNENKWFINCGSLGCPMGENIARAGILNIDGDITYEQLSVPYDVNEAVVDIRKAKYPDYENILKFFY